MLRLLAPLLIASLPLSTSQFAEAATLDFNTLHSFSGNPDGSIPGGGLTQGVGGSLFGTTQEGGAFGKGSVFSLTAPANAGGPWIETVIYSFQGGTDGAQPDCAVTVGPHGELYGTTEEGGNGNGTIFSLSAPTATSEKWVEAVLYRFPGVEYGDYPASNVFLGQDGALFGETNAIEAGQNGHFYKLSPPAIPGQSWQYADLYTFSPSDVSFGALTPGPNGEFFLAGQRGGDFASGGVGQLVAPGGPDGAWIENTIYSFSDSPVPVGNLVLAPNGVVYGTTVFGGTSHVGEVFELTPPAIAGGHWTENTLYSFSGAEGAEPDSLLLTPQGLIGTTTYGGAYSVGIVFLLHPPANGSSWSEVILHSFLPVPESAGAGGQLVATPDRSIFGITANGGNAGLGTVYRIHP